jgi:LPXTG-motif cell wall-anchored protein
MVCLAAPTTLVSAQAPAPPADADVAPPEIAEAPTPEPQGKPPGIPPPPSTDTPEPSATPPPAPTEPGEATPPPPVADSSTTVSAAGSASVSADDNTSGDNFFAPSSITIQVGGTVTWSNDGQVTHTVTANSGSFDSGNLNPGQSFSHTFSQPGTFAYYCQYHQGMKGSVTVQAADSSGGGGASGGDPGSTQTPPAATAPGSESAAVTSPGAAGSAAQLPSTGMPVLPLLAAGVGLLLAGALLRRRARVS